MQMEGKSMTLEQHENPETATARTNQPPQSSLPAPDLSNGTSRARRTWWDWLGLLLLPVVLLGGLLWFATLAIQQNQASVRQLQASKEQQQAAGQAADEQRQTT